MTIDRDVILDLLPIYLADEASEATRALVEQYLADDPALAKLIEQSNQNQWDVEVPLPLNKEHEMKSFEKTKQMLLHQRLLMAFAIMTTLMALIFHGDENGARWLWADSPEVAAVILLVALIFWVAYGNVSYLLSREN